MTLSDPHALSDLDDFVARPRVERLDLSPDGSRVVLTVATLDTDRTGYERALWEVAADGSGSPKRLTRSTKGESGPGFTASGDLLFVSSRPGSGAPSENEKEPAQVWKLPADGGEARPVSALAGGVDEIAATAADTDVVVLSAGLLPGASTLEEEATLRADRRKLKVSAILHERYPVRYWDQDLGPGEPHLLAWTWRPSVTRPCRLPPRSTRRRTTQVGKERRTPPTSRAQRTSPRTPVAARTPPARR